MQLNQALLVIDAQQDLIEGNMEGEQAVFEKERLIANINSVIEKAIHDSVSVTFIRDLDVAGGKGAGFQIHEELFMVITMWTIFQW